MHPIPSPATASTAPHGQKLRRGTKLSNNNVLSASPSIKIPHLRRPVYVNKLSCHAKPYKSFGIGTGSVDAKTLPSRTLGSRTVRPHITEQRPQEEQLFSSSAYCPISSRNATAVVLGRGTQTVMIISSPPPNQVRIPTKPAAASAAATTKRGLGSINPIRARGKRVC